VYLEDATDNFAVRKQVEIVFVPGLPALQRIRSQIVPIQLDRVEGVQEYVLSSWRRRTILNEATPFASQLLARVATISY
jgi:hypothetical protein